MAPSSSGSCRMSVRTVILPTVVCLIMVALVVAVNISSILTSRSPAVASSLFFANAEAYANLAQQTIIGRQTRVAARQAIALSHVAIARDPLVPAALAAAGMASEVLGNRARTRAAMILADRLSRRILPVQLWLIEDAVQRGDIPATLYRYDVTLRTNRQASLLLFPILNAAIQDSAMVDPVARILAQNPGWRSDFTAQMADEAPLPGATALATRLSAMRSPLPAQYASVLMLRLSRERDYSRALSMFWANFPAAARARALVRDPTFATPGLGLPFGWQFVDGSEFGVAPATNGRAGAQVYASSDASGEAARQLIMLPPGAYRLVARYTNAKVARGSEPRWQVVCGSEAAPRLAELPLVSGVDGQVEVAFTIPVRECPAQWIFLIIPSASRETPLSVDLVSLLIDNAR